MKLFEEYVFESAYNLIKTDMPNVHVLYHTSNPHFRNNIAKEGLTPQVGASYSAHYNDKTNLLPGIFLSVEKYDSTYDDDIYEIDTAKLDPNKLYKDPDEEIDCGWFLYADAIPVNAIKLIYKGSGEGK